MRSWRTGNASSRELPRSWSCRRIVRGRLVDAVEHQSVPFERLVQELQSGREQNRHPIFQVLVAINPPGQPLDLPRLEVQELETEKTVARFDLTLLLQESSDGVDAV